MAVGGAPWGVTLAWVWGWGWKLGSVGEWVGGLAAAAAVGYAVLATRRQLAHLADANALERERWEADRQDRLRWQARLIACKSRGRTVRVNNATQLPVHKVAVWAMRDDQLMYEGINNTWTVKAGHEEVYRHPNLIFKDEPWCGVTFVDCDGERWVRRASGELEHVTSNVREHLVRTTDPTAAQAEEAPK